MKALVTGGGGYLGAALVRRGVWLDENDVVIDPPQFDPGLAEQIFEMGGDTLTPSAGEACAASGCHAAPLWTAGGTGDPPFIQAVTFSDIPIMAAYLCLIAAIFVVINLVVDLLYFAVDPRLRVERTAGAH